MTSKKAFQKNCVDARGTLCPAPLMKTVNVWKKLVKGEVMTVYVSRTNARNNIESFLKDNGSESDIKRNDGFYTIKIKK